jgi:peptidoglycan/xylan/chitin deacetylase (PgdA/CDA1 family)
VTNAPTSELVAEIVRRGHEPACHGHAHRAVYVQTRAEFRDDVTRALEVITSATGRAPVAYRAPAFSITRETSWAYDVLAEAGIAYDSSQYDSPRIPNRIGRIPTCPYRLELSRGEDLWELPVAARGLLPVGGGAYWRVLPARVLDRALADVRKQNAYPVLYFHPYEFDEEPLEAALPPSPSVRQQLTATARSLWRNTGRQLVARRLREVGRRYELLSYEQAYDDIHRLYGTRTRALSQEGVLV